MSERGSPTAMQFPRPGKALKGVLYAVAGLWLFWAIAFNWIPGGKAAFAFFVFAPVQVLHGQVWRLFTAGLLSPPTGPGAVSHLVFMLIGLYFLSPDLERRWGGRRFIIFLVTSLVAGWLLALAVDQLPIGNAMFHPGALFGMTAAITATAVAWSRENADREVRLFFVLPVKGRHFLWLTVGWCVLSILVGDESIEGVVAPFGGVLTGLLMGGTPSPLRAAYLSWKLASLKKQSGGLSAAAMLEGRVVKRKGGAGGLRVVQGGLEDDLKKREPPRDKRYLN
jgi:membrane associated rhomboid family serine protease